ncbi:hypothetical protein FIBSPDRAFT_1043086 [Athelia psychrophila]|uniref:Uncharacterized protein n=1 Tax=Athelia psychrophila TaxID=1759441 RepID=A0A166LMI5_9AGAM|nr:hypothetical protein FIBSPDRAFT_1043086 [Fibularhizoctonia sp. CBS 109695]
MTDLTVLIAPQPLPRTTTFGSFARRAPSPASRPIAVTLQPTADEPRSSSTGSSSPTNTEFDSTWKPRPRPAHIHTPTLYIHPNPHNHRKTRLADIEPQAQAELDHFKQFDAQWRRDSSRTPKRRASTRAGEPVRPTPPLFRPTTFWRHARRSTFAAGLTLNAPRADPSALSVESRSRVGFVVIKLLLEGEFFYQCVVITTKHDTMPTHISIPLAFASVSSSSICTGATQNTGSGNTNTNTRRFGRRQKPNLCVEDVRLPTPAYRDEKAWVLESAFLRT